MRLATYNVENLFDRAKVLNLATWTEGRPTLEAFAALSALLGEVNYTAARKAKMAALMATLGLARSDTGPFVTLRRNRGDLLTRSNGKVTITAAGRADWSGTLELRDEPVDDEAMRNCARAIAAADADVLAVVEAESRPVLAAYNAKILAAMGGAPYRHVMLIDGNDDRGIDVGLMSRDGFPIGPMRSHVDDRQDNGAPVFSRDCAHFCVATPAGATVNVLVNHFKSKGFGAQASSNAKRKAQAARVAEIYDGLVAGGAELVAVVGDFNDTPVSDPLQPLLAGTTLKDAFAHPAFDDGGFPGTFGLCSPSTKIDYLLLSPALFAKVTAGGLMRKAMWPGVKPKRWETFAEVTAPQHAGSDHALAWVDLDV